MNTERCPKCSVELIVFPDALGYVRPVSRKCMKCGATVRKRSLWGKLKNIMKWNGS